jgi:hypothetical protein
MMNTIRSATLFAVTFMGATGIAGAQRGVVAGGPDNLADASSLGDAIAAAGTLPLHIIQIHGIGSSGAGDSLLLRHNLCKKTGYCSHADAVHEYADRGKFNPALRPDYKYMGGSIWGNPQEWIASAPFVDHYVLSNKNGQSIIVDEINWWPLVFAVKCRNIIRPEAGLAGLQKAYLGYCSATTTPDKRDSTHYSSFNWLDKASYPVSGTKKAAPPINKSLKVGLLDWRLADAELASGDQFRGLLIDAISDLLVKCASFNADGTHTDNWNKDSGKDQQFVLITHSLGSYLALSTLGRDFPTPPGTKPATPIPYIYAHTSLMYFFANQIALLELGNIDGPPDDGSSAPINPQLVKQNKYLTAWAQLRKDYITLGASNPGCQQKPQLIAWSDPSDLLTYPVPKIDDALVTNLYVQNSMHWLWSFEGPIKAHDNYVNNKHVVGTMLRSTKHSCN